MTKPTRSLLTAIFMFTAGLAQVFAQDYPNKGIRVAVGATPGGPLDTVMRLVGDRMKDSLGQPILVDNRPGAGGVISFDLVRAAAPDGYTLLMSNAGLTAAKFIMKAFTADALNDFTHIGQMTNIPMMFVVNAGSPYKSVTDFLSFARAHPGKINMGSLSGHFAMDIALLQSLARIQVTTVQYGGTAQQQLALLGSVIDVALDPYSGAKPGVDQGKTRFLALAGAKRFALAPEIAAVAEFVPGFEGSDNWFGLAGPAGLPPPIVARLNASLRGAILAPDIKKRLNDIGFDVIAGSPEDVRGMIARDLERMAKAAALAGIKPQ